MDSRVDRQYGAGCSFISKMDSRDAVKDIQGSLRMFNDWVIIFLAHCQVPSIRNTTSMRPASFAAARGDTSPVEMFRERGPGYRTMHRLPGSRIRASTRTSRVKSTPT